MKYKIAIPLFFIKKGQIGGAEEMAYNLVKALADSAIIDVYLNNKESLSADFVRFCQKKEVNFILISKNYSRFFLELLFPIIFRKKKYDLVLHLNYFMTPFSFLIAKKVFTVIHDLQYLHLRNNFPFIKRVWLYLNHINSLLFSSSVIAISDFVLDDINKKFSFLPMKKVFRLYNIIDFNPSKYEKSKVEKVVKKYALCISANYQHKNINTLINAFQKSNLNKTHSLVLIGQRSENLLGFHSKVTTKNCEDGKIIFTGYIKEKEKLDYIRNCDLFCFPSLFEGFGMPVVEAMKFNKPILCSDIKVLREISNNTCNYVGKPHLIDSWVEKLNEYLNESDSFKSGEYQDVLDRYSKKTIARELVNRL